MNKNFDLPGPAHGLLQEGVPRPAEVLEVKFARDKAFARMGFKVRLIRNLEADLEDAFVSASEQCERSMGWNFA